MFSKKNKIKQDEVKAKDFVITKELKQKVTRDMMNEYFALHREREVFGEEMTDYVRTSRARGADCILKCKDPETGKPVELKEDILWREIEQHGIIRGEMKKKYPKIMEYKEKEFAILERIRVFEVSNFGFTYSQMTLPNVMRLINSLVKFRMEQDK